MKNKDEQPKSFEASLEALEEIVHQLEGGDLPLEKSLELFEDGIRLSRQCQERLNQAERRIEVLLRDNQGRPVVSAFAEAERNVRKRRDRTMKTTSELAPVEMLGTATDDDLAEFLVEARKLVDAALDRILPAESVSPVTVHAAIRWSVFAGGKRFRPVLLHRRRRKLLARRRNF